MSEDIRNMIDKVKNFKPSLNEQDMNKSEFGFGEFLKPKKEVWLQLMDRAKKDGLLSDIHYNDKTIFVLTTTSYNIEPIVFDYNTLNIEAMST